MSLLKMSGVSKVYGSGRVKVIAVNTIDLEVDKGEIVLIMGPSGSGKTTLLSMAGGLLTPTSGRILINDSEITKLSHNALSRVRLNHTGFVFQSFNLLESLTALENVEVSLNLNGIKGTPAINKSKEMLDIVGLKNRLNFYPKLLSAGEKQRVAIARSLINNPDIILADEPTGNLDKHSGKVIMELFKNLVKESGKGAVIVTHDERIEEIADKVLWLEDGVFKETK